MIQEELTKEIYPMDYELLFDVRQKVDASNVHNIDNLVIFYKSMVNRANKGKKLSQESEQLLDTVQRKLRIFAATGKIVKQIPK